jgi:hypothetical protein
MMAGAGRELEGGSGTGATGEAERESGQNWEFVLQFCVFGITEYFRNYNTLDLIGGDGDVEW